MDPSHRSLLPLAAAIVLASTAPASARAQAAPRAEWRGARWGMTVGQVLAAFPGEATRLDPPLQLADGNAVAAEIAKHVVAGTEFKVAFVFDAGGGLALVSLRTGDETYAKPEQLGAVEKALADRLGPPTSRSEDREFIDMRQVTWKGPTGRVDLKYIPGKIVVLHAAPSQRPAGQ